ncbi:UDP-3-O-(3-hydroxymyristoyl)glucosamine N-acyltransferase [Psychromarinibacter sp. C21-152]|uniref:UDP-3-O-acylglucosamine N-acyltransferase n=1 Tax=Psychromarinibacter sediminicola TaxID=3033385 RepID=A0AAE3NUK2_9RHOB|nr:UDP-3-O-(3-hydroxymyristoyl)glucosamine N-acyltransferase [Psychromarinibacter sediminicola]MDF0602382.1 UDP-3-O-(3-hydroxymyristoyl)glucosamine N-acyltransferase [Psychromarinibacter sediminicola]
MQAVTIAEIAQAMEAEAVGDTALTVRGVAEPASAGPDELALAMDPKYAAGLSQGQARAAVLWPGADWQAMGLEAGIYVHRARLAMAGATRVLDPGPEIAPGVHPSAVVDPAAQVGPGAAIGPFVHIGRGARIGANARIAAHVSIGAEARIGDDALIHAGARIGARVTIGARFIAQPGAVVGADGLSFVTRAPSRAEAARANMGDAGAAEGQPWIRIHSLGAVTLGDDVEIGANACIDAGTIRPTSIGSGTKIDNLVHIAHNCRIGRDCLFAAHTGIAGSVTIGDNVIFGGKVGVVDNVFVGDNVVAGGGTNILSNVPAGRVVMGYPAVKMETHTEMYKALRRLPRLAETVAGLKKAVSKASQTD